MEKRKYFAGFWHYGVIITYLSGVAGVVGACLSVTVSPVWGLLCIIISALCDSVDGAVASTRKNRTIEDRKYGSRIDMLCDVIAFGITPVAVGIGAGMTNAVYILIFIAYVTCAVIRLGYFEMTEDIRMEEGAGRRTSYEGMPVAGIVGALPVFYLAATCFTDELEFICQIILAVCYAVCAFLFIFKFKTKKLTVKQLMITISTFVAALIVLSVVRFYWLGIPLM